jgi:uncharacterized membrane protein
MAKIMFTDRWYPVILFGGSAIGLVASFWQAVERMQMLKHPTAPLSCNLNPVLSCGDVLSNRWASLFGFPNAFIGMVIFAMLFFSGYLLLVKTKLPRLAGLAVFVLDVILILFALWFFGMSLYVIGAVCLFCIFIWAVAVPVFWYGLLWAISQGLIKGKHADRILAFGNRHHLDVLLAVYVLMLALYFFRFRGYYFTI